MRRFIVFSVFTSTCFLTSAAMAAPGDLLVAEISNGTVLEFSAGGDLSAATRFATGLDGPTGLCVGPNGDIYVGELGPMGSGEVTVITAGGDFAAAAPFAFGFGTVVELFCDDNTLYVADQIAVYEASAGGDFSMATPFATGTPSPAGLERDAQNMLWVSSVNASTIHNITGGGDFSMAMPHATGRRIALLEVFNGMLLGNDLDSPGVFDFTAGGDFSMAMPFASLPDRVSGLLDAGPGTLYAVAQQEIYEISAGGDFSAAMPFATGLLDGDVGIAGMVRHVCSVDADCDDADACNGAETCANNECLPAIDPLDCDDMDVCTADSCDPAMGCVNDPIMGCCQADADCDADEVCDVPNNMCVPDMMGTTGDDGGMTSTTGPGTTTTTAGTTTAGDGSSGDDDGGTAGATDDGDDGCSCRADAPAGGLAWLLPGLALLALRRRSRDW